MLRVFGSALVVAAILAAPAAVAAQAGANEESVKIAGGGITAPGWMGQVDAAEAAKGLKLTDAKLAKMGESGLHVTTGPSVGYWNPANKATGNYMVKATFTEPKYMSLNDHAHPYGIMIGGNDLGTDQQSYLYCMAYGNGTFIVRGFGPNAATFRPSGNRPTAHAAINKAAGKDQPVTQEIALTVRGDQVSCSVNGTVVGTYPKASVIGPAMLKSTDGIYGIRSGHNTEVHVTGLTMTKY
jgi:hypothetical protein